MNCDSCGAEMVENEYLTDEKTLVYECVNEECADTSLVEVSRADVDADLAYDRWKDEER